jgi:hypothetical protein
MNDKTRMMAPEDLEADLKKLQDELDRCPENDVNRESRIRAKIAKCHTQLMLWQKMWDVLK